MFEKKFAERECIKSRKKLTKIGMNFNTFFHFFSFKYYIIPFVTNVQKKNTSLQKFSKIFLKFHEEFLIKSFMQYRVGFSGVKTAQGHQTVSFSSINN